MMKNLLILCLLTACSSSVRSNTPSPAECEEILKRALSAASSRGAAFPPSEQLPRPLNPRVLERRLADTVTSLPIDSVPQPVVLRWRLTPQGRPEQVTVARSSGVPAFDSAAVWAMGFVEFEPARLDGCPVAVWIELPIEGRVPRRRRAPASASGVQGPPRP